MQELTLQMSADARAVSYIAGIDTRRVVPDAAAIDALAKFDEHLPEIGCDPHETLRILDEVGSPATVASNGPRYFGFVVGAALPVAAAVERLMLAWDQGAPLAVTSPVSAAVEEIASRWLLEILDLPRGSAIGFGTSASSSALICLAAARRSLLVRAGWDVDRAGTNGAPRIKAVVSDKTHITVLKALRILGLGTDDITSVPTDQFGRIIVDRVPPLDALTILCLQAGEVNTGEFDSFSELVAQGRKASAWVHIDGAFGLWARATRGHKSLTEGVEDADSWVVDGHKWLNTPYDCAMAICRDPQSLAAAMNSDAAYAAGTASAQKNLTLDFSRRPRGIPVWAALRSLGRSGVDDLVSRHIAQAALIAESLKAAGYTVLNRVVLNQVLARCETDQKTRAVVKAAQDSGTVWFGSTTWEGQAAFRISVSSWRTSDDDIAQLCRLMGRLIERFDPAGLVLGT
ncbi:pyridoxal phosphate-dependent decarboxylase family protein [Roseateles chitinivorans]|uniref:pyridoxal phosphate-dependent decarboxylase family protein n=1 Tax=Roseateles chitinivorans TaxID=2917965 RepID=UPI003D67DFF0